MINLLILAVAPSIALGILFYLRDKHEKEPFKLLLKVFILGGLSVVPIAIIEMLLFKLFGLDPMQTTGLVAALLFNLFLVAIIEEGFKFMIVRGYVWNNKNFNEPYDGIMYTVMASLGFATVENIFYVIPMGFEIGVMRAVLSVPLHALTAVIMGYYIGVAKYDKIPHCTRHLVKGFAAAVLIHGFFNFFVSSEIGWLITLAPLLIAYAWRVSFRASKWHAESSPFKGKSS